MVCPTVSYLSQPLKFDAGAANKASYFPKYRKGDGYMESCEKARYIIWAS